MDAEDPDPLSIPYRDHDRVRQLCATIRFALEGIAVDEPYDEGPGPGAYLLVVAGPSVAEYADPMGANRWPASGRDALGSFDEFFEAMTRVAATRDGAVVAGVDGVVNEQLVRVRSPASPDVEYAPWMGARHMSALDTSTRDDVVVALTLSAESGRVSVFTDGSFASEAPDRFGRRWRGAE